MTEETEAPESRVIQVKIEEELKTSFLDYSMSFILSRALPDVRDGLKPSQRRILVAMNDLSLAPNRGYRKCAKIAGDTSGNYHPHGEAIVYPTLVHMAQDFRMRYPLVQGQGNFGSIDIEITGSGKVGGSRRMSMSRSQRVSPVTTFLTPIRAQISPE